MTPQLVPLREVAELIRGVTFKPADVVAPGTPGATTVMRTKNVQQHLDLSDRIAIPSQLVRREAQLLREGDTLVSSANSWDRVGKACWVPALPEPMAIGGFVTGLRSTSSALDSRYLFHWFTSPRTQKTVRSFGNKTTNISNLNLKRTAELGIPLPRLEEQRRIAAILDQADALRAKRREALALLDDLAQSIFIDMFWNAAGEKVKLVEAVDVRSSLVDPTMPEHRHLPHIAPDSIEKHTGRLLGCRTAAEDAVFSGKYKFEAGDVLYSKIRPYLNKVTTAGFRGLCSADMYALVPRSSVVTGEFLAALLRSLPFLTYAEGLSNRANIPKLNRQQLENFEFTLPPLSDQQQYSRRVHGIDLLRGVHCSAFETQERLFAALQARAFSGRL